MSKIGENLDAQNTFLIRNSPSPLFDGDLSNKKYVDESTYIVKVSAASIPSYTPVGLSGGQVVIIDTTNASMLNSFIGFTVESATIGSMVKVQTQGLLTLPGWGLVSGSSYLLANYGGICIGDNPTIGFKKVIGYAISGESLLILHQEGILK